MKKVKIIILLFSIFLLCGCNSKMVLEINNSSINETLSFEGETPNKDDVKLYKYILESDYGYEINEEENKFTKSFSFEEYQNDTKITESSIIDNCFRYAKILKDEDNEAYTFMIGNFRCEEELEQIDKLDFIIKTDGIIINSNKAVEDNGELIWTFTKDNYKDQYIYFTISHKEQPQSTEEATGPEDAGYYQREDGDWVNIEEEKKQKEMEEKSKQQLLLLAGIVGGFVLIVLVAFFISIFKANKNK